MPTIYEITKEKITTHLAFRERALRGKYLSILALRHCELNTKLVLNNEQLSEFAITYASYERSWRQVLLENPSLQGTDYGDKTELEQTKKMELGYEPKNTEFENEIAKSLEEFDKES